MLGSFFFSLHKFVSDFVQFEPSIFCILKDLKDYMRQAGEVTYADAHKQHKNEGVVEFASYSDMKRALDKLDETEINGRKIRLVEDKPRRSRRSSR
uniref:RRM domain-containing protein n=1 Tax=Magallana gigas TaxID=29159 RepID=A0A8W8HPI0_MAGGI